MPPLPPADRRVDTPEEAAAIARRRAAVLWYASEAPVGVSVTTDPRALVGTRLGSSASSAAVWYAASLFEAELLSLALARAWLPTVHREARARLGVWWLRVDPENPGGGWRIVEADACSGIGRVVGPFLDRSSALRWSQMLEDVFELCRYPAELRRSPDGTPCVYKEMGRCPAACDGSEPMPAYLDRLGRACELTVEGVVAARRDLERSMRSAAGDGRFEQAAAMRDRLAQLPEADEGWVSLVAPGEAFRAVLVTRSERRGWARVLAAGLGWCRSVCDTRAGTLDDAGAEAILDRAGSMVGDGASDDAVTGLVARTWARPGRAGPRVLRIGETTAGSLCEAVRSCAPA